MVDLEAVIVAALRADPAVLAAVGGDRIYTALPASPAFPCVRITLMGGAEGGRSWQPSAPQREALDVQIDVWGGSRAEALHASNVIRFALGGSLPGACPGGAVAGVLWDSIQRIPDDDIPTSTGRARERFLTLGTFTVHHSSPA
jgi:hypothetical protein